MTPSHSCTVCAHFETLCGVRLPRVVFTNMHQSHAPTCARAVRAALRWLWVQTRRPGSLRTA